MQKQEHGIENNRQIGQGDPASESRLRLIECIEQHNATLLGSISLYARRMGLDGGTDAGGLALDIWQETVVEALGHADNFTATRQPIAWLLGISLNVIKRKKVEQAKHASREISLGHLSAQQNSSISEEEILDHLKSISGTASDPAQALESDEEVTEMLSLVSPADQEVLRLAVLEDLEREMLAQRLGTTAGTARMRLHRALHRLRLAWFQQKQGEQKGESHE